MSVSAVMSSEVLMLVSKAAKQPCLVRSETITSSIGCHLFPSHTRPYGNHALLEMYCLPRLTSVDFITREF